MKEVSAMTKQRSVILSVIRSDMHHLTAEEIFSLSKKMLPGISRATVYNNLHTMEAEGLVRRIGGEGNSDRYDSNPEPHGHFFCNECGGIFDIMLPEIECDIENATDFCVSEYELKVRGVCRACRASV